MQDPVRPKVRAIIESLGSPASRAAIAAASDLTSNQLSNALYNMQRDGELTRTEKAGKRLFSINPDFTLTPTALVAREQKPKKQSAKKSGKTPKKPTAAKPEAAATPPAENGFPPSLTADRRLVLQTALAPLLLTVEETLAVADLIGANFEFA